MQGNSTLNHCWWGYRLVQSPWKTVCQFLMQLHTELLYHPAAPLLGIYPRERKDPCVDVDSSSIHNCPKLEMTRTSFSWWMKIQSLCASLQYLNLQQWKRVNYCIWQNHRWILLIHGSQTQKAGCVIPLICLIWKRQNFVDREKISDCWRLKVEEELSISDRMRGYLGLRGLFCIIVVMWWWWWIYDYAFLKKTNTIPY